MRNELPRVTSPERPGGPSTFEFSNQPARDGSNCQWAPKGTSLADYMLLPHTTRPEDAPNEEMAHLIEELQLGTNGYSRTLQLCPKALPSKNKASSATQLYPSPRFLQLMACARTIQMMLRQAHELCGKAVRTPRPLYWSAAACVR